MSILATLGLGLGAAGLGKLLDPVFNGLGNLISGGTWEQSGGQIKQNEYNAKEAEKAYERQLNLRDTAIDSQVAQLERNGINTAMHFSGGGSGAATPNAAMASGGGVNGNTANFNIAELINAGANVAQVMNNDKHSGNNMNAGDVINMVSNVARIMR